MAGGELRLAEVSAATNSESGALNASHSRKVCVTDSEVSVQETLELSESNSWSRFELVLSEVPPLEE